MRQMPIVLPPLNGDSIAKCFAGPLSPFLAETVSTPNLANHPAPLRNTHFWSVEMTVGP
jgi:hypothetical protein